MRGLIGRIQLEQFTEAVDRSLGPTFALIDLGDPCEQGQIVLREGFARPVRPIRVPVIRQRFTAIQLTGGDQGGEFDVVFWVDRGFEGLDVDPQVASRAKAEDAVPEDEDPLASIVRLAKGRSCDADRLMEIVQGSVERTVRPERLDQLFTMHSMPGGKAQDPDELARLAQPPSRALNGPAIDFNIETTEQSDANGWL